VLAILKVDIAKQYNPSSLIKGQTVSSTVPQADKQNNVSKMQKSGNFFLPKLAELF
jgi:hypothetical protein